VDGYPRVMPDFSKFSEQKVADLIAYLHTLE
jgi:cytochrome c1